MNIDYYINILPVLFPAEALVHCSMRSTVGGRRSFNGGP